MFFFLSRDDRGATALEYALIAGLLGLGILGSLVTTKGSLNAVFGTASRQMASSTGGATDSTSMSSSTRPAFWQAKTLVSQTKNGAVTTYKYSDGSMVNIGKGYGGVKDTRLTVFDASGKTRTDIYLDTAGNQTYYLFASYYDAARTNIASQVYVSNATASGFDSGTPPAPKSVYFENTSLSGSMTSNGTRAPNGSDILSSHFGYYDAVYFKDMTP